MLKNKVLKYGVLSLTATLLLAACDDNDTLDTTPVEEDSEQVDETSDEDSTETTEDTEDTEMDESADEEPAEEDTSGDDLDEGSTDATDSPGIEGMTFAVSLDDAIDLFYETFGSQDINIDEIQFEHDDGRYIYEFDGWDGEYEYELDIDAETRDIVKQEQELDSDTDDILDLDGIISPQEAMDIALEAAGSGYVEEWDPKNEQAIKLYESFGFKKEGMVEDENVYAGEWKV